MNIQKIKEHKVLIIDNDEEIRRFLIILLISEDFDVDYASDGREALQKLGHTRYGLVLADTKTPFINTLSLLDLIKEKHLLTEVIVTSSKNNISETITCLRSGAFDYLPKPFENIDIITSAVNKALMSYSIKKENEKLIRQLTETNKNLASIVDKKTSKLKDSNQKLKEANKKLVELQETLLEEKKLSALGSITAGFAHEINNPIHNILLYTELMMRTLPVEATEYEFAQVIKEEVQRISNITGNILNYSRKTDSTKEIINLFEFFNHFCETHKNVLSIRTVSHSVSCDKDHYILADRTELYQIILNLITNAVDAIDHDHGEIAISSRKSEDHMEIIISDNGSGIPEEIIERIFEPFFSTKEVGKGTGLGLYITYNLVRKNKGHIEVKSSGEYGTTIQLSLPAMND